MNLIYIFVIYPSTLFKKYIYIYTDNPIYIREKVRIYVTYLPNMNLSDPSMCRRVTFLVQGEGRRVNYIFTDLERDRTHSCTLNTHEIRV